MRGRYGGKGRYRTEPRRCSGWYDREAGRNSGSKDEPQHGRVVLQLFKIEKD
jgi:hypothetical protein